MGSIGDCDDNSLVESFWGTMQLEFLDSKIWRTRTEFFFSSRRRHTRLTCDWSSDVCSSDLGAGILPHVTGHPHAAHDRAGKQALTNGAGTALPALRTVRLVTTAEAMTFHHTFKAAPFGRADGVNIVAGGKQIRANGFTGFDFLGEVAEFADALHGLAAVFLDVSEQRLGQALFLLVVETELDGIVTVLARLRFDLHHAVGTGENDRNGDQHTLRVIDAGVTEFFS